MAFDATNVTLESLSATIEALKLLHLFLEAWTIYLNNKVFNAIKQDICFTATIFFEMVYWKKE